MSFARAAEELNVTPAALSFQIKSLEERLGRPVFRRLNRAVELTEAGQALQPGLRDGFDALQAAWRNAQRLASGTVLNVTAGPAITSKWLAPRMFEFAQHHPDIELRFSATLKIMDFERDEIDVAIRFGGGDDAGLYSRTLITEWVTPMMTPALAERFKTPESLRQATLLHQDLFPFQTESLEWGTWFRIAGLGDPPKGGPRFSQADHAIDSALSGTGVVMGRFSMAEGALSRGQLVAPYPLAIQLPYRYRFLCRKGQETRPHIAAFEAWLMDQINNMQPHDTGRQFVDIQGRPL